MYIQKGRTKQTGGAKMNTKDAKLLKSWEPCKDGLEWGLKQKSLADVFDKCDRSDWLIWLIRKVDCWDHRQKVMVAVACASHVLKYAKCKEAKAAIDAAKAWLDNPCEKTQKAASAAYAASAASAAASASAAYAAASAADAYAAASAASAAASASAAYADASAAYADASADERKWQSNAIRKIVKNPFTKENG
jgi:hypothetical protein